MRKVTVSALMFAVLFAAAAPAGSQTRPRRVGPAPDVYSESGPRTRAEEERAPVERPRRGSRWRRVLLEAGLAAATVRRAGRSCTPSRRVIGGSPR
jgi:hypothetical protein